MRTMGLYLRLINGLTKAALILIFSLSYSQKGDLDVHFAITENSIITPCNVRIYNEAGTYLFPDATYDWNAFFGTKYPDYPSNGEFTIALSPGKYRFEIDRGPEYNYVRGEFEVTDKDLYVRPELRRMVHLKKMNWWSGEMHIHRKQEHIERLMLSGDLHIAPVITSWNDHYNTLADSVYKNTTIEFANDHYYRPGGSEDERNGGAILVLNTAHPVDFTKNKKGEYPPLASSIEKVKNEFQNKYWIDIEKPFWWDVPILLATQRINSIEVAHNHMNRDGIFEGEGLGKARDIKKYPGARGNGYWTQELYYKILNTGLRIAPSAGSASGVLLNPVGYNRIYALVENDFNYDNWFQQVNEGRTFITNGPLIICSANGKYPGEVFKGNETIDIIISTKIFSRDSLEVVEIIKNGEVVKRISAEKIKENSMSTAISFHKSGWFLIRVIAKKTDNFRFASTAPFYVEIGEEKKQISRSAAQYFLDWTNERANKIKIDNMDEKAEIFNYIKKAQEYWSDMVSRSNAE